MNSSRSLVFWMIHQGYFSPAKHDNVTLWDVAAPKMSFKPQSKNSFPSWVLNMLLDDLDDFKSWDILNLSRWKCSSWTAQPGNSEDVYVWSTFGPWESKGPSFVRPRPFQKVPALIIWAVSTRLICKIVWFDYCFCHHTQFGSIWCILVLPEITQQMEHTAFQYWKLQADRHPRCHIFYVGAATEAHLPRRKLTAALRHAWKTYWGGGGKMFIYHYSPSPTKQGSHTSHFDSEPSSYRANKCQYTVYCLSNTNRILEQLGPDPIGFNCTMEPW